MLPKSLYFLSTELRTPIGALEPQGVCDDPDSTVVERVTPPDHDITSLDIRPGDGRIPTAQGPGQIFTVSQDGQSNLLYDAGHATGKAFEIGSLDWSPNGEHPAFTMHFKAGDWASQEGGLWLMDEGGQVPVKPLDNHYRDSELDDVAEVRMIRLMWIGRRTARRCCLKSASGNIKTRCG